MRIGQGMLLLGGSWFFKQKFEKGSPKNKKTQMVFILLCSYFLINIFVFEGSLIQEKKTQVILHFSFIEHIFS